MPESKTKATQASVEDYLAERASPAQQQDCAQLIALMRRISGQAPTMWGPSMVGFGSYRYATGSGCTGDFFLTGFAVRQANLAVYLTAESADQAALLQRLGKHKMGKACLTIKRLADLDLAVLEQLITDSVTEVRRRHG